MCPCLAAMLKKKQNSNSKKKKSQDFYHQLPEKNLQCMLAQALAQHKTTGALFSSCPALP